MKNTFLFLTLLLTNLSLPAKEALQQMKSGFSQNQGQVHDQNNVSRSDVIFIGHNKSLSYFFKSDGFSYQQIKYENNVTVTDPLTKKTSTVFEKQIFYRTDFSWINNNNKAVLKGEELMKERDNYYLPSCPDGITDVKNFGVLRYQNIYPGIDVKWYDKNEGLKYDYLVAAGSDYRQIRLKISGASKISISRKFELVIETPLGKIIEEAPLVFQGAKQLNAKWIIEDDIVSFEISGVDSKLSLLIDPGIRTWATYYGGSGSDLGFGVCTDAANNVYMVGNTTSSNGNSIATSGSHQSTLGGPAGPDIGFLVKFDVTGQRLYGTYYGGPSFDKVRSVCTDPSGNVIITGYAQSNVYFIVTQGAYQSTNAGAYDAFIAKFNSSGVRQWGTYYGESGLDYGLGCCTDLNGDIFIVGYTLSNSGSALASTGAFQSAYGGGNRDGFVAKFSSGGNRLWGSYYGSIGYEELYSCSADPWGNVYISGYSNTLLLNSPMASPGAFQIQNAGADDIILAKFNGSGSRLWATYYGGQGYEYGRTCLTDALGNPYVAGDVSSYTYSDLGTSGTFMSNNLSLDAGFISKFDTTGNRVWGTYFNGASNLASGYGCAIDSIGNLFLVGIVSANVSTVFATPGAYQSTNGGQEDCFIAKFNNSGLREWSTYYGGNYDEFGMSCAVDHGGHVYLCGYTQSTVGINSSNAYQTGYGGFTDALLVQFEDCRPLFSSVTSNASLCSGSSLYFSVTPTGSLASTYSWTGPQSFVSAVQNPFITYVTVANSGNYSLTASNITGCFEQAQISVTVHPLPTLSVTSSQLSLCKGNSVTLSADGANSYTWTNGPVTQTFATTPLASSVFTVTGQDLNSCKNTATVSVTVFDLPNLVAIPSNTVMCIGESASLTVSGASTYSWNTGESTANISVTNLTSTTDFTVIGTDQNGCAQSLVITQSVSTCAGVNALGKTIQFTIYPNPNRGVLIVESAADMDMTVLNELGQILLVQHIVEGKNKVDLSEVSQGVYFLKISTAYFKIVKE